MDECNMSGEKFFKIFLISINDRSKEIGFRNLKLLLNLKKLISFSWAKFNISPGLKKRIAASISSLNLCDKQKFNTTLSAPPKYEFGQTYKTFIGRNFSSINENQNQNLNYKHKSSNMTNLVYGHFLFNV